MSSIMHYATFPHVYQYCSKRPMTAGIGCREMLSFSCARPRNRRVADAMHFSSPNIWIISFLFSFAPFAHFRFRCLRHLSLTISMYARLFVARIFSVRTITPYITIKMKRMWGIFCLRRCLSFCCCCILSPSSSLFCACVYVRVYRHFDERERGFYAIAHFVRVSNILLDLSN